MSTKKTPKVTPESEATEAWTPPDVCPKCGNPGIIVVAERRSIVCPECRKEIPC